MRLIVQLLFKIIQSCVSAIVYSYDPYIIPNTVYRKIRWQLRTYSICNYYVKNSLQFFLYKQYI